MLVRGKDSGNEEIEVETLKKKLLSKLVGKYKKISLKGRKE